MHCTSLFGFLLLIFLKIVFLFQFDALKRGDDLGDDKLSDSFRKTLAQNLNRHWSTLQQINRTQQEKNDFARRFWEEQENHRRTQQEEEKQRQTIGTIIETGGGAVAGAGIGAVIGGPIGAGIGLLLGGIFGYNM